MTEADYLQLGEICDGLLREDAGDARIANAWLHVIREHPVFLHNYAPLFESAAEPYSSSMRRRVRLGGVFARQIARSVVATTPWFPAHTPAGATDVLFVSHALTEAHAREEADFYFGGVPQALAEAGYTTRIALINYTRLSSRGLAHCWRNARIPRLVLSRSLRPRAELGFRRRLGADRRRLVQRAVSARDTLQGRVLRRAAEECLSSSSLAALRLGAQVGQLVRTFTPRVLVTTHEGHAWERMAYLAAREASPSVITVGYQHAAVFRLQHAMKRRLSRGFDPDVILTAGLAAQRQLSAAPGLEGIRIGVLGSDRAFAQNPDPRRVAEKIAGKPRGCIVLPESLDDECRILFEFSMACARQLPDISFIWRLHPLMTIEGLLSRVPSLRTRPANCVFSTATLDEDLAHSQWALYRGTTAIVRAVGDGCRPLYLRVSGEIPIDPLHDLADWRATVNTVPEFIDAVHAVSPSSTVEAAVRYCATLFVPFDATPLVDLLRASASHDRRGQPPLLENLNAHDL